MARFDERTNDSIGARTNLRLQAQTDPIESQTGIDQKAIRKRTDCEQKANRPQRDVQLSADLGLKNIG